MAFALALRTLNPFGYQRPPQLGSKWTQDVVSQKPTPEILKRLEALDAPKIKNSFGDAPFASITHQMMPVLKKMGIDASPNAEPAAIQKCYQKSSPELRLKLIALFHMQLNRPVSTNSEEKQILITELKTKLGCKDTGTGFPHLSRSASQKSTESSHSFEYRQEPPATEETSPTTRSYHSSSRSASHGYLAVDPESDERANLLQGHGPAAANWDKTDFLY